MSMSMYVMAAPMVSMTICVLLSENIIVLPLLTWRYDAYFELYFESSSMASLFSWRIMKTLYNVESKKMKLANGASTPAK